VQICQKILEIKQLFLHDDINKKEDLDSFKIEQTHFVSSLSKTLESLEELPLSTKIYRKGHSTSIQQI
jgi:hypothetical protein